MRYLKQPISSYTIAMMKTLLLPLILLSFLAALQVGLWHGQGSLIQHWQLAGAVHAQTDENTALAARNASLHAEVADLQAGLEAIEERARAELGMVKPGETFYQVIGGGDDA